MDHLVSRDRSHHELSLDLAPNVGAILKIVHTAHPPLAIPKIAYPGVLLQAIHATTAWMFPLIALRS